MSQNTTLGFIGVGMFATYMIKALRRAGNRQRILLPPRTRAIAEELAQDFGCELAADSAEVVARADMVFISVRPPQIEDALAGLTFRKDQIVISGVAGVSEARLRELMPGAGTIVRIMPAAFVETGLGLFPLYPANEEVEALLRPAGEVVSFDTEEQFGTALVGACLSGWTYRFCHELVRSFMELGITEEQARLLVMGNLRGTINYAMESRDRSLMEFSDWIAAEGTFTGEGFNALFANDPMVGWRAAIDAVEARRRRLEQAPASPVEA